MSADPLHKPAADPQGLMGSAHPTDPQDPVDSWTSIDPQPRSDRGGAAGARMRADVWGLLALAVVAVTALFLWEGQHGFSLWDEGFLWYGVQRVLAGEVPLRDFMAYDPARYYWSAALMSLAGEHGIVALRATAALIQSAALFTGLVLIARSAGARRPADPLFLTVAAVTVVTWMYPRHKLFDISMSISLLGLLTLLIESPSRRRYFVSGLGIGVVALFGRNHALYGVVGSAGAIGWILLGGASPRSVLKGVVYWAAGVLTGFGPLILMVLLVPGFASAFWDSVKFVFEQRATNLPLPVPWPWTVNVGALPFNEAARQLLIGGLFIATLLFGVCGLAWLALGRIRRRPRAGAVSSALVAAACLALPYAHVAFSRADVPHLAQSIFPLLIGGLCLLAAAERRVRRTVALGIAVVSLLVMAPFHPGWPCRTGVACTAVVISGDTLTVDPATAGDVALLRQLSEQYAPSPQTMLATPFWPGAYALLDRKAPVWEVFALFPRSQAFEEREIERLRAARPGFALVVDIALDGREELRFRNTHPRIFEYITNSFEPLPDAVNPLYQVYRAKSSEQ